MHTTPLVWRHELIWTPQADEPKFRLVRRSSDGHLIVSYEVPGPEYPGAPTVEHVLEEMYSGVLQLMEVSC